MISIYSLKNLYSDYDKYIKIAKVMNTKDTQIVVDKIKDNKHRYEEIENKTQIPWELIAAIHSKESNLNFARNLCNGEPLNQVTKLVPRGLGPWSSFEDSAVDAIKHEIRLQKEIGKSNAEWSMIEALHYAQGWNGFGYISKGIPSPYLWSGSNIYKIGGYKSDGNFDKNHVVKNVGVWCILNTLGFGQEEPYVKLTWEEKILYNYLSEV